MAVWNPEFRGTRFTPQGIFSDPTFAASNLGPICLQTGKRTEDTYITDTCPHKSQVK